MEGPRGIHVGGIALRQLPNDPRSLTRREHCGILAGQDHFLAIYGTWCGIIMISWTSFQTGSPLAVGVVRFGAYENRGGALDTGRGHVTTLRVVRPSTFGRGARNLRSNSDLFAHESSRREWFIACVGALLAI